MFSRTANTAKPSQCLLLQTVSASHYSEKVRWCLDLLQEPYEEQQNVGVLGLLTLGRTVPTLIHPLNSLQIGNSSTILRYLWGEYGHTSSGAFLKPDAKLLELEKKFDRIGRSIQRSLYFYMLPHKTIMCTLWGETVEEVPRIQRILLNLLFPVFRIFINKGLKISEKGAQDELQNIENLLEEMDELLNDGRDFINAESLSFIDITFCSLIAPVCIPPINEFGAGKANQTRIQLPQELLSQLELLNERHETTFSYVRRIYSTSRK